MKMLTKLVFGKIRTAFLSTLLIVVGVAACSKPVGPNDVLQDEVRNDHGSADTEIVDSAVTDNAAGLDSETVVEDAVVDMGQEDTVVDAGRIEVILSVERLDFDWVRVDTAVESEITLENASDAAITISVSHQPDWDAGLSVELDGANPVAVGSSLIIKVRWQPVSEDVKIRSIGKLKIVDGNSTVLGTVPVTGGAAVPKFRIIPTVVDFNFQLPVEDMTRDVTIHNNGMFAFSLTGMSIDCSGYPYLECQRESCPVSVELQDVSFSDGPILLDPDEFISVTVYLDVLSGPVCPNGDVVVKLETDIRTDPYEFYVDIN